MNGLLRLTGALIVVAFPAAVVGTLLSASRTVWFSIRRVDPRTDAVWLTASPDDSPAGIELIGRYLRRIRCHRFNGAFVGCGLALLRGLSHDRRISIGVGGTGSPLGDLLFGGLAGLLVGSVLAETWRIRPRGPVRHAELAPRSPQAGPASLRAAVVLLTATTVTLGIASRQLRPVVLAVTSLVLLGVHRVVRWAIAERGRPALPVDLRQADDAIRRFASRRLDIETLAAAVLLTGWQVASVQPPLPDVIAAVLALASLVGTVVLIRASRPWPPRRLLRAQSAALVG